MVNYQLKVCTMFEINVVFLRSSIEKWLPTASTEEIWGIIFVDLKLKRFVHYEIEIKIYKVSIWTDFRKLNNLTLMKVLVHVLCTEVNRHKLWVVLFVLFFFLNFFKFQTVKDGKNLSCYVSLPFIYKLQYSLNHILDATI